MFWGRQINFHLLMSDFGFKWYQRKWSEEIEKIMWCIVCPEMKCFVSFRWWIWYCFWGNAKHAAQQVNLCNCSRALIARSTEVPLSLENMIMRTVFFHFTTRDLTKPLGETRGNQKHVDNAKKTRSKEKLQYRRCDLLHGNDAKWDKREVSSLLLKCSIAAQLHQCDR